MKLPNSNRAIIDRQKLEGYCLNSNHSDGQHKAYVFKSVLGIGLDEADVLRGALFQAVQSLDAVPITANQFGQKYVIDFMMTREAGNGSERLDCSL